MKFNILIKLVANSANMDTGLKLIFSHWLIKYDGAFDRELRLFVKFFEEDTNFRDMFVGMVDSTDEIRPMVTCYDGICINKWKWGNYILMDVTLNTDYYNVGMLGYALNEEQEYVPLAKIEDVELAVINDDIGFERIRTSFQKIRKFYDDDDYDDTGYFSTIEGMCSAAVEDAGFKLYIRQSNAQFEYYRELFEKEFVFLCQTKDRDDKIWDNLGLKKMWTSWPDKIQMQVHLWSYCGQLYTVCVVLKSYNSRLDCYVLLTMDGKVEPIQVMFDGKSTESTDELVLALQKRKIYLKSLYGH